MKDECFIRDKVPMTKEAIRAISIDKLQIEKAQRFLDIGAGTGSISLQVAKLYPQVEVLAIESKELAVELIQKNREHFEVNNLNIIQDKAPIKDNIGKFESIFVGGTGGNTEQIIDWAYDLLTHDGNLVMNFILLENAFEAFQLLEERDWKDIDMINVNVSELTKLGKGHYFKPQNPTIILSAKKENKA